MISLVPVRADHLSCYGYRMPTTPTIDAFGKSGTLFENVYSTGAWTPPAHASTLTGLFPSRHGVLGSGGLNENIRTLPELLGERGYRTAGFVNSVHMGPFKKLDRGFDEFVRIGGGNDPGMLYRSHHPLAEVLRRLGLLHKKKGSRQTTRAGKAWLTRHAQDPDPFFLLIHYHQAHHPYLPPWRDRRRFVTPESANADWRKVDRINLNPHLHLSRTETMDRAEAAAMRSLYDAELHHLDRDHVGAILHHIDSLGLTEHSIVVMTSPHGENLGDHGLSTHVGCLYDTLLRVPLIFRYPPSVPAGMRVGSLAQVTDVAPTLFDLAGLPPVDHFIDGASLLPFAGNRSKRTFAYAEWAGGGFDDNLLPEGQRLYSARPEVLARIKTGLRMIRVGDFKLIRSDSGSVELFDIVADPGETVDLATTATDRVEELSEALDMLIGRLDRKIGPPSTVTADIRSELQSLGYRI
jgi:arylsulfatase A-like enzyme